MKREQPGAILSTVFVDYDNIYLSLKRKNEEAAKRFAKDAPLWVEGLVSGRLITPTNSPASEIKRRIVMNRCYGNPVPRRNSNDNSTDMNSFPFVRHHFLRAGFEVVDCPPLTAQLKNSSDIRMVMDVRDYLTHDTYFEEFIILSGDADFTPLLHRLRAHARRTVIFANDHTAAPYTAISDGEVREADLINLLMEGRAAFSADETASLTTQQALPATADLEGTRRDIIKEVVSAVRSAGQPVPLEALADRAVRNIGHDRTVGTAWGGAGSFRDLLLKGLPEEIRLNEQPPYFVYDASRQIAHHPEPEIESASEHARTQPTHAKLPSHMAAQSFANSLSPQEARAEPRLDMSGRQPEAEPQRLHAQSATAPSMQQHDVRHEPAFRAPNDAQQSYAKPTQPIPAGLPERHTHAATYIDMPQMKADVPQARPQMQRAPEPAQGEPHQQFGSRSAPTNPQQRTAAPPQAAAAAPPSASASQKLQSSMQAQPQASTAAPARAQDNGATAIQRSIARIHEACQAPPLSPPEYRMLFDVMAQEINQNGLNGHQTLTNIAQLAEEHGVDTRRDDIRFVLDVISETDPWFDQGASAKLFAGRFRNFVVARCRSQGLNLSADELDLIDAWFAGPAAPQQRTARTQQSQSSYQQGQPSGTDDAMPASGGNGWYGSQPAAPLQQPAGAIPQAQERFGQSDDMGGDEFPRIVRRGLR